MALVVFCAGLVCQGNTWVAMRDLAQRVGPWHRATLERYQLIREAARRGQPGMRAPALPAVPRSYFDLDFSPDPLRFLNRCAARYFGVASIARAPSP